MSTRSLLVLALLTLGLFSYLYFFGFAAPSTRDEEARQRTIAKLKVEDVRKIELTNPDGTFVFQKKGAGWSLEKPVAYPAAPGPIGTLLSEVEFTGRKATLDKDKFDNFSESMKKFGLNPPRYLLRLILPDEVIEVAVGNETARAGTFYAMASQGKFQDVVVIDKALVELLAQNLDVWRSKKIFDFQSDKAVGLVLKRDQQEVEVSRQNGDWKVLKPLETLADKEGVGSYLAALLNVDAQSFVSETGTDLPQAGLTSSQFTLEVKLEDGTSQTLRIGQPVQNDPTHFYAQFGDRPAVFTLTGQSVNGIAHLLDTTRDRRVVDLGKGITGAVITAGTQKTELKRDEKTEAGWMLPLSGGRAADTDIVQQFLQSLNKLRAVEFLGSVGTPIPAYGLQKPQMTIQLKVMRDNGQVTDETIKIGAAKGDTLYVESSFVPFIVTIPKKFVEDLPKQNWDWFALHLGLGGMDEITGLEWVTPGGSMILTRQPDGKSWKANREGIDVDVDYLRRQLQMVAELTAFRWNGPWSKKDFAKPVLTLKVTTPKGVKEIIFGSVENAQTRIARIAGDDYAFTLPEEGYQKLQLQPIKVAAPAP